MSAVPDDLKYSKSHEWIRRNSDGTVTIGISDHAQSQLGDLVYVEVPDAGRVLAAGDVCAVVESVKAASDVYTPLAGTVVTGNDTLEQTPEAAGWCS
jgi:glycine cleavage system H protein